MFPDPLPPGLLVGHRIIRPGDEAALRPGEAAAGAVPAVRRASGAARIAARRLLAQLGHPDADIPRGADRAPRWPAGVVGTLAHEATLAMAAVASSARFAGIGIDVEADADLPAELAARVANPGEAPSIALFVVKEAVFKAVHPRDGVFLDFADIVVDFAAETARTRTGHVLRFAIACGPHVVALAWH
jgi:4'-phosphopantetheinyl transferase EntD